MSATLISPNFNERDGVTVDMLVLHYTGMKSAAEALARMCDPTAEVSAHYMIDEDGTLTHLVDEQMRAWHAGVAMWRGFSNINSRSIGIELVNPGHEFGYRDFPDAQMATSDHALSGRSWRDMISRPRNVVGHSDVAPERKQDPGERFDWAGWRRMGSGFGRHRDHVGAAFLTAMRPALSQIGYDIAVTLNAAVIAHFSGISARDVLMVSGSWKHVALLPRCSLLYNVRSARRLDDRAKLSERCCGRKVRAPRGYGAG